MFNPEKINYEFKRFVGVRGRRKRNCQAGREIFKEVAGGLKPIRQEPLPEEFLSRKEVLSALKIDSSTL